MDLKVKTIIEQLRQVTKQYHFWCDEDNWYSCPKAPDGCANEQCGDECNCGAEIRQEKQDRLFDALIEALGADGEE